MNSYTFIIKNNDVISEKKIDKADTISEAVKKLYDTYGKVDILDFDFETKEELAIY